MRARGLVVVAVVGVALASASCKPTVEGETKTWEHNTQRVQQLSALYPGFSAALKEQQKHAEDALAAAKALTDKVAMAKKMSDANDLLSNGFVGELGQLDSNIQRVRDEIVKATSGAQDPNDQAAAKTASDDAQRVLTAVDATLKTGAADAASAAVIVGKAAKDLSSANANLQRVVASERQHQAQAKKLAAGVGAAGAGAAGAGAAAAPGAPVAVATWKCPYCGHVNAADVLKCPNCGAARPEPKAAPHAAQKK